jgi:hypothetical protein
MSIKTRVQATTVALLLAAAGIYYVRSAQDTSQDRDITLILKVQKSPNVLAFATVFIGKAERLNEPVRSNLWTDHMWIRPGEVVHLDGRIDGNGVATCTIIDQGHEYTNLDSAAKGWESNRCSTSVVG